VKFVFYKVTEFKETPIGEVPRDWKVVRLKNIAKIIMGQSPPSSTYNKKGEGLPFLQGKAEFGFIYPSPVMYCSKPIKIAEANDVLISVRAPVGDVNIALCRLCIGRGLAAIRFNNRVASYLFYFYYLQKVKKNLETLGKGSTFKAIVKNDLESLAVPLMPLPEQKAIAHVLSTIDEAIQKTNKIIEKIKRLKKGSMQELLTKGIGHKEFKDTKIGKIPKEWEIVKVQDILSLEYGKGLPERERITGEYPVVGSNGIIGYHNQAVVKGPGIVVGRKGTIGAVTWINSDFWPIDTTYYVKTKITNISLKWLFYELIYLNPARFHLADVVPGLKREFVYALKMPLPPLSEQQKIAEILSTIDKRLEAERKRKEKLERIKKALMDLLLTGKVRIKVITNVPNEKTF